MNKLFTVIFTLLLTGLFLTSTAQVIYVDVSAVGNDNGQSWADAFHDLQDALAIQADTILVAQGTYKPDAPNGDPATTFLIDENRVLFGGYSSGGLDYNPSLYETILSGDLNGDDQVGDFNTGRMDNTTHVLTILGDESVEVILDGLTIRSGYAFGGMTQSGGGINCTGGLGLDISNCTFQENFAFLKGGALFVSSANLSLDNCTIKDNLGNTGGGFYFEEMLYQVDNCSFQNNIAQSGSWEADGGAGFIEDSNGTIEASHFEANLAEQWGGALFVWSKQNSSNASLDLLECTFETNSCVNRGGGINFSIRGDNSVYNIWGCTFLGNVAQYLGGGGLNVGLNVTSDHTNFFIDSCFFQQNTGSGAWGGGLRADLAGTNIDFDLTRSSFNGNNAGFAGGGARIYGSGFGELNVLVDDCVFEENSAPDFGGLTIGSLPGSQSNFEYLISNCTFLNNQADGFAGGLDLYSEAPAISTVENCLFDGNTAGETAGGIGIRTDRPGDWEATVRNCILKNNNSPFGAAIGADPALNSNGLMTLDAQVRFENCLITGNIGDFAIASRNSGNIFLLNCTIADNDAHGIGLESSSVMTLQNTLLQNSGTEFINLTENGTIISYGGNLISDESLNDFIDPLLDKPETLSLFDSDTSYVPACPSPQVNGGVNGGVTALFDLAGNERIQGFVDIGAYETDCMVGVKAAATESIPIRLFPNPTSAEIWLEWLAATKGTAVIQVFNLQGERLLYERQGGDLPINVKSLPDGVYLLKAQMDGKYYTSRFQKF